VTPIATSDAALPAPPASALDMVQALRARKDSRGRSAAGLAAPRFPEG
jgi:hypothetical protein